MTSRQFLRFVITGAPGSGKGTISDWIVRDFGLRHVAAGDLLRNQMRDGSAIGKEASKYISQGKLVPDELVTKLVLSELDKNTACDWLIDGFPRNVTQAKSLDQFCKITSVIDLVVPHEDIIDRIKGRWIHEPSGRVYNTQYKPPVKAGIDDVTGEPLIQRQDDDPQVVKARLVGYDEVTAPILDHYRRLNLLIQFRGNRSDQIYVDVHKFLHQHLH